MLTTQPSPVVIPKETQATASVLAALNDLLIPATFSDTFQPNKAKITIREALKGRIIEVAYIVELTDGRKAYMTNAMPAEEATYSPAYVRQIVGYGYELAVRELKKTLK